MATKNLAQTVTHKIVFTRRGNEMSTTAMYPIDIYNPAVWTDEKLAETGSFCWHSDDWRLVTANLYAVSDVELPVWLDASEWLEGNIAWKYVFGYCKDGIKTTIDPKFLRYLKENDIASSTKLALIRLMETKNFKSDFRKAMKDQVVSFLETPADSRKYRFPLSPRQVECIMPPYANLEARRIDSQLYRN
jgi:hypothetical protein